MRMPCTASSWILSLLLLAPGLAGAQTTAAPAATTAPAAAAGGRNEAGKIELVSGAVSVMAPDRSTRIPQQGEMIYEGDAITTGADGELQAEMLDAGVIAVRPNTQMRITKYQAQGDATDTSVFGLIRGSFRSITGWIGKNNPARYQINTPTATIGVRGTDHEPLVVPEGATEGEPGTYDKVSAGGSYIQGKTGRVDVSPGKAGFFAQNGRSRPRLLAEVPRFYRPSRNESRLEGRHDRVRASLDQRRTERQQFIRERRAQRAQAGPRAPGAQGAGVRAAPGAAGQGAARQGAAGQGAEQRREARQAARQQAAQERKQPTQAQQPASAKGTEERRRRAEELRQEREKARAARQREQQR